MRIRNKSIPIRVTEKELEMIDKKATKAKLSRTDYLIYCALGKEINVCEELKPILGQLSRIGNNLNQLTRLANSGAVKVVDLIDCTEKLGEIHTEIFKFIIGKKDKSNGNSETDEV